MKRVIPAAVLALMACGPGAGGSGDSARASATIAPVQVVACFGARTACGSTCADLRSDPANCGACGRSCGAGQSCVAGTCAAGCGGLFQCGSICIDRLTDPANCGTCGLQCQAGSFCVLGLCSPLCPDGFASCPNGVCANLSSSLTNCGACGRSCAVDQQCVQGQCTGGATSGVPVQPPRPNNCFGGLSACGDACVDLLVDRQNCGFCGRACPDPAVCVSGTCL